MPQSRVWETTQKKRSRAFASRQTTHHPAAARPAERIQEYLNVIGELAQRSEALATARTIKFQRLRRARSYGNLEEEKIIQVQRQECNESITSKPPAVIIKAVWEDVLSERLKRRVIRVRGIMHEEFVEQLIECQSSGTEESEPTLKVAPLPQPAREPRLQSEELQASACQEGVDSDLEILLRPPRDPGDMIDYSESDQARALRP